SCLSSRWDDPQANPAWTTMIGALIAILLVIGAAHLIEPEASDISRVQDAENGDVKLDGRGKWTGYM
ncbi:MAG: hypothetical protein AAFW74_10335, partial [Pseudomonadota bacterium]